MRKFLLFLVLLILIGGGFYFYNQYKKGATTTSSGGSVFKSFFPVGNNQATNPTGATPEAIGSETPPPPQIVSPFTQISARAVAGFSAYTDTYKVPVIPTDPKQKPTTKDVTDTVVRYISRANGYVYEKRNTDQPIQVSNVYIPNIYEGYFTDDNQSAILRFLRDDEQTIATYVVPIPPKNPDGTRTQKPGMFLNDNISSFSVSPDEKSVARLFIDQGQGVVVTSGSQDTAKRELLRSPFSEWLLSWPIQNALYLQTKPAATVEGFLYKVDQTERKLRRVLGNINGLTASVSPSGTYILYSESIPGSFTTKLFNTKTNITTTLNLKILPEKCTWLPTEDLICAGNNTISDGVYPDGWYAGVIHFSDKLFKIYTKVTTFDILYDGTNQSFDMTNLSYASYNNSLYFIDKNTGVLWQFKLP